MRCGGRHRFSAGPRRQLGCVRVWAGVLPLRWAAARRRGLVLRARLVLRAAGARHRARAGDVCRAARLGPRQGCGDHRAPDGRWHVVVQHVRPHGRGRRVHLPDRVYLRRGGRHHRGDRAAASGPAPAPGDPQLRPRLARPRLLGHRSDAFRLAQPDQVHPQLADVVDAFPPVARRHRGQLRPVLPGHHPRRQYDDRLRRQPAQGPDAGRPGPVALRAGRGADHPGRRALRRRDPGSGRAKGWPSAGTCKAASSTSGICPARWMPSRWCGATCW